MNVVSNIQFNYCQNACSTASMASAIKGSKLMRACARSVTSISLRLIIFPVKKLFKLLYNEILSSLQFVLDPLCFRVLIIAVLILEIK